jgi:hypothetical protein
MEEFLIEINGRLVRIVIEDVRGDDGAIPTLVCRAAQFARVLPLNAGEAAPGRFPGMPRALNVEVERGRAIKELRLDVSDLSSGLIPFSIEQFAAQAERAVAEGVTSVRLTNEDAEEWGSQLVRA